MGAAARLVELGLLESEAPTDGALRRAVSEFQRDAGLVSDGVVGMVTSRWLERHRFCGVVPKRQDRSAPCRWDHVAEANGWDGGGYQKPKGSRQPLELTWHFAERTLTVHKELMQEAFRRIEAVCGVVFVETANAQRANFLEVMAPIDRRGGTLALHYLPCSRETGQTQLGASQGEPSGTFDNAERWDLTAGAPSGGRTSWLGTVIHEIGGHGLGLEHGPQDSIMSPYSNGIVTIDEWTRAELVKRYGPPIETTSVPSPGAPNSDGSVEVRIGRRILRGELTEAGES